MDDKARDDQNDTDEQLPQPMGAGKVRQQPTVAGGHVPSPPKPDGRGGEAQDVAAIERQEKIDRLRTREDQLEQYDDEPPRKKHRFLRFLGWIFLIVLLTGAGAAAGWYYWLRNEPKPQPKDTAQTEQTPPPAAAEEEAEPTEHHNSTAFRLQFDYPQTWKVAEGADNKIVATSPAMKFKTAAGQTQTGQIVLTIQHKQVSLPEFKDGNALAAIESEKIDYAKPSQVQRASTYLSFLNYAASTAKGIDGVYVTGDSGYVKDQYIPLADIVKADPLIAVTFRSCSDDKCAKPDKPLTLPAGAWQELGPSIKTILQSIIAE